VAASAMGIFGPALGGFFTAQPWPRLSLPRPQKLPGALVCLLMIVLLTFFN